MGDLDEVRQALPPQLRARLDALLARPTFREHASRWAARVGNETPTLALAGIVTATIAGIEPAEGLAAAVSDPSVLLAGWLAAVWPLIRRHIDGPVTWWRKHHAHPHRDHIHLELNGAAAAGLTLATLRATVSDGEDVRTVRDPGDLLAVADDEQLDVDPDPTDWTDGAEHAALVDFDHPGDDTDALTRIFDDPGEVRDLDREPFA